MTFNSFKDYLCKYGFDRKDTNFIHLFHAFNYENTENISFDELLLGLSCIEPNPYNGISRIKFVFRYYDADGDGFLNESEFRPIVRAINKRDSAEQIDQKLRNALKLMKASQKGISFKDFLECIGSLKFRGTSLLCRSEKPIFWLISQAFTARGEKVGHPDVNKMMIENVTQRSYKGVCNNCKKNKWEVSPRNIKLKDNGEWNDPQIIEDGKN